MASENSGMGSKFRLWKTVLQLLVGVMVSTLLLTVLVEGIRKSSGEFQLEDLAAVVSGVPLWVFGIALACQLIQGSLRSIRFSLLLKWDPERRISNPGFKLLMVTFARSMFVDMLPSRSGELIYVWLVKRMFGANIANGFSSLGAAFVFDLSALLILIFTVVGIALIGSTSVPPIGFLLILLFIVASAVAGFFFLFPWIMGLTESWRLYRLRTGISGHVHGFFDDLSVYILEIRKSGRLLPIFLISLIIRLFKYAGTVTMLFVILERSFGSVGFANIGSLLLGIVGGEASASLPLPSFMSFGTYEAGASLTLQGLGFSLQAAAISIFIVHVFSQFVDYSLGIAALVVSWLSGWLEKESDVDHSASLARRRWLLALSFCGLLGVAVASIVYMKSDERVLFAVEGGEQSEERIPPEDDGNPSGGIVETIQVPEFVENGEGGSVAVSGASETTPIRGFAVWSSNRFGNHEIVKYAFETRTIERITNSSEKEYYVSISPNGKRLIYMRSENPDLSRRVLSGWQVVVHDLQSGQTEVVSDDGFQPSWAGDDFQVVYSHSGKEVVLHDLSNGTQRVLIRAGENGIPSGFRFWTPSYDSKNERLAVTIRGSRRTKMIYSMNSKVAPIELPEGCQLSWIPGDVKLVFTNHGEIGDNAFQVVDPVSSEVYTLLDLPTEYDHIYFPRFSDDGEWLIYGASMTFFCGK